MKILIATNNKNKISEIQSISSKMLNKKVTFISPLDLNIKIDPIENGKTFAENAEIKAVHFYNEIKKINLSHIDVLADDSGLEVEALNGMPGVYSARFYDAIMPNTNSTYTCMESSNQNLSKKLIDKQNTAKLLNLLIDKENRKAKFTTVIALYNGISTEFYVGECHGKITYTEQGTNGFGYDSIFIPNDFDKTFAEMNQEEKNAISHRRKAMMQFFKQILLH